MPKREIGMKKRVLVSIEKDLYGIMFQAVEEQILLKCAVDYVDNSEVGERLENNVYGILVYQGWHPGNVLKLCQNKGINVVLLPDNFGESFLDIAKELQRLVAM